MLFLLLLDAKDLDRLKKEISSENFNILHDISKQRVESKLDLFASDIHISFCILGAKRSLKIILFVRPSIVCVVRIPQMKASSLGANKFSEHSFSPRLGFARYRDAAIAKLKNMIFHLQHPNNKKHEFLCFSFLSSLFPQRSPLGRHNELPSTINFSRNSLFFLNGAAAVLDRCGGRGRTGFGPS